MPQQIDFSGLARLMEIVNQGNVQAIQAQNAPRFTRDQSGFGQRGAGGLAGWYKNNPDFRPGENDAVGYQRIQDRTALEQQGARNAQAQAYNEFLKLKGQEFDMRRAEAGKRGQAWTPGGLVPNAANVPGGVKSRQPAVNPQGATPQQQTPFNPAAAAGNLIANMTGIAPNAIQQGMQQIGQPKQSAAQPPQMPVKSPMPTQSPFGQASPPQSGGLNYRQQIEATRFGPPAQSQARPTYYDMLQAQRNPGAQMGIDVWPIAADQNSQFTTPPVFAPDDPDFNPQFNYAMQSGTANESPEQYAERANRFSRNAEQERNASIERARSQSMFQQLYAQLVRQRQMTPFVAPQDTPMPLAAFMQMQGPTGLMAGTNGVGVMPQEQGLWEALLALQALAPYQTL